MPAKFIAIGDPSHDSERQALRFLVDGLPSTYTVYANPWLVERSGVIYELDAVVVAPWALFVVEIKSYRGRIGGTDHDWYVPSPIKSPLKLNRLTAQVLKSVLKREAYQAGHVWVEGLVFLSATTDIAVKGPASRDRLHSRKTILAALQDRSLIERLSGHRTLTPTSAIEKDVLRLFTGLGQGPKPERRIREYVITEALDHSDAYSELLGKNELSAIERVLRIYKYPPLAEAPQRERVADRARWEAQVLGRLGRIDGILKADPPFADEAGIVLPLERFEGITLATWIERYGPDTHGKERADLRTRTDLWMRIARVLDEAHNQGVVHRLLRPEVILVEDKPAPAHLRVTGFDLAKQLASDTTVALTSLADDRLVQAAPEVVTAFSSAEPASDQFSLGAILAMMLTGRPLFETTRKLMVAGRLLRRVRDIAPRIPLSLDEAVARMLERRPNDRYPTLQEAITAVDVGRNTDLRVLPNLTVDRVALNIEDIKPGTPIGTDYVTGPKLGYGAMAVVYAARHLPSGQTRALKIARDNDAAEDTLRAEHRALRELDHPNIVKVVDLTKMVEGHITLVMERAGEKNLRQWLATEDNPSPAAQRRLAEDLFAGLDYLEQKDVTHKDLKPDNLLVHDGRLTIIDFSLADTPADAPYGGTALYRDPASAEWSHATDRYAAALCLFELYTRRHAFDGKVPEPGQELVLAKEDIDPPGLAELFKKALHKVPEQRFPSARAMRDAFVRALGDEEVAPASIPPVAVDGTTPLRATGLSRRAVNALARCQVHTVAELLALSESQVRAIHNIGSKTASDILEVQRALRDRGVAGEPGPITTDPPLVPDLCDCPEPVQKLALSDALLSALAQADLPTVGAVASLTRHELLAVSGIGRKKLTDVVEALHQFRDVSAEASGAHTMDRLWALASSPLSDAQRITVERAVGLTGEPEVQAQIAGDLGKSQPQVSLDLAKGLERVDLAVLAELNGALDTVLDSFGGIVRLDDLGARLEEEWPAGVVSGTGIARLLVRLSSGRAHLFDVDGADSPLVARPVFDRETIRAFAAEVVRLASHWPPLDPETVRRNLAALLPDFEGDPIALGKQLCHDVHIARTGHLFIGPLDAKQTLGFILEQTREPMTLAELERRVQHVFGPETHYPEPDHLLPILRELDCRVQGEQVLPGRTGSVIARAPLSPDQLVSPHPERSPEEAAREMLQDAAQTRGFRMLVAPPERHGEIARSVAAALGATWLSFDEAFFEEHGAELPMLERAERFVAQRDALTEAAESTLFRLLEEHGQPGRALVLGDTALLGLCEALDLPRRLYDETLSGSRGFWVLVVPGVIQNRQPRFNEGPPMWHLEGATLALLNPLRAPARQHPTEAP